MVLTTTVIVALVRQLLIFHLSMFRSLLRPSFCIDRREVVKQPVRLVKSAAGCLRRIYLWWVGTGAAIAHDDCRIGKFDPHLTVAVIQQNFLHVIPP
jgi:hypothetical protein